MLVLTLSMRLALCALLVGLVGCSAQLGGASGGGGKTDDDQMGPDAGVVRTPDASVDAPPAMVADNACGTASDHGTLGNIGGQAGSVLQEGSTTNRVGYVAAATPNTASQAAPDLIVVELWDGYGAFQGGAARTGTFQITGAETDYDTCGVCVVQLANVTNNTPTKRLLATSGTVTVTSVGTAAGQTISVSVSNASFVEVAFDPNTGYSTVAGSNCPSPIASVGMSDAI